MSRLALDRPRAPHVALDHRLYESHYVKVADPHGGRALWVRQTALKRPGAPARGTLWAIAFDRAAPRVIQCRETFDPPVVDPGPGAWASFGGAQLGPGAARGTLEPLAWDLTWTAQTAPSPYLPSEALYDRRFPTSNGVALVPSALAQGTIDVDGARWDVTGWPGMVGHNWGTDHAAHWVWIHAAGLPGGAWVDLVLARVQVGPLTSPWMASGAMEVDGVRRRLGGPTARLRGFKVALTSDHADVRLPEGMRIEVTGDPACTATWDYAAPDGPGRDVRNCSVADGTLTLGDGRTLSLGGAWAFEVGRPAGAEAIPQR